MTYLFRLSACLFVLLSFNAKALVINGCTIEPNASCAGADLSGADLSGADLSGADLSGADLTASDLLGADLSDVDLTNANLTSAHLDYADLTGTILTGVYGRLSGVFGIDNSGITLPSGYIISNNYIVGAGVDLSAANLMGAYLFQVNLTGAKLSGADLSYANLDAADLSGADLSGINLSGAALAGVALAGADLSDADLTDADLSGIDLTNANLTNVDLTNAIMSYADLTGADLTDVSGRLSSATFNALPPGHPGITLPAGYIISNYYIVGPNVDLTGANLIGADLIGADLIGADLTGADLTSATLVGVSGQLSGALGITLPSGYIITNSYIVGPWVDLTDTDLTGADLAGVDLSGATLINVSGQLSDASGITLPSGYTLEGLVIKADGDNDGYSDELEIAISGDTTSVDSTTFAAALSHLTADADNDGVPDDYETAAGGDTTSSTFGSVLAMLTVNKNVPAMGGIGLLALGLSMLGIGAVRLKKKS